MTLPIILAAAMGYVAQYWVRVEVWVPEDRAVKIVREEDPMASLWVHVGMDQSGATVVRLVNFESADAEAQVLQKQHGQVLVEDNGLKDSPPIMVNFFGCDGALLTQDFLSPRMRVAMAIPCRVEITKPPFLACGSVPDGSLMVSRADGEYDPARSEITLTWDRSCGPTDLDYEVYEGSIGRYYSHRRRLCSTGGKAELSLEPDAGNRYYLVVPRNRNREGSYGGSSDGAERPVGEDACLKQFVNACP